MHAKLFLVTSFAASVLAAPLPATPIESPVEAVEPLMVRDASPSAVISPILENMKREILERLEAMVEIKRSAEPQLVDGPNPIDKRDPEPERILGAANTNEKRTRIAGAANTNEKRERIAGAANTNEKRERIGGAANTNDKREPEPERIAGAASTNEKRQKPTYPIVSGDQSSGPSDKA